MPAYKEILRESIENSEEYWSRQADRLHWFKKYDEVLEISKIKTSRWFPGGLLNICYNCIDRHVEAGKGDKVAYIFDSPSINQNFCVTYQKLKQDVEQFAWGLTHLGVVSGDRVIIYMPKVIEGLVAMLACSRIGAVQCALYTGLPESQIAHRMTIFEPKIVVTANTSFQTGRPINLKKKVDRAIELSEHKPDKCLIIFRPNMNEIDLVPGRDVLWEDLKRNAGAVECTPVESNAPIYLLQTSGTTGAPKAVVAPTGGFAVGILNQLETLYGTGGDDIFLTTSEYGWQVAQDYICYGSLLLGCTSVVYEGDPIGTPDSSSFFRLIEQHKITRLITNLSAFRAIRKANQYQNFRHMYNLTSLRDIMATGQATEPETMRWASRIFGVPVIDGYGQTEAGRFITGVYPNEEDKVLNGEESKIFPATLPIPGWNVKIIKTSDMTQQKLGDTGRVLIKLPLPPGSISSLWKREDLCEETYFAQFPGYYDTKDEGQIEGSGALRVIGRLDDVMKVRSLRVAAGAVEEAILKHPSIAECVVVALPDEANNYIPLGLYIINDGVFTSEAELSAELIKMVNDHVAENIHTKVVQVQALPKTYSGKTARHVVKQIVNRYDGIERDSQGVIDGIEQILRLKGLI